MPRSPIKGMEEVYDQIIGFFVRACVYDTCGRMKFVRLEPRVIAKEVFEVFRAKKARILASVGLKTNRGIRVWGLGGLSGIPLVWEEVAVLRK